MVEINRDNCTNLYFDEHGDYSYSRIIHNKLVTISGNSCDIITTLSNLCKMSDDTFMLVYKLSLDSEQN